MTVFFCKGHIIFVQHRRQKAETMAAIHSVLTKETELIKNGGSRGKKVSLNS